MDTMNRVERRLAIKAYMQNKHIGWTLQAKRIRKSNCYVCVIIILGIAATVAAWLAI